MFRIEVDERGFVRLYFIPDHSSGLLAYRLDYYRELKPEYKDDPPHSHGANQKPVGEMLFFKDYQNLEPWWEFLEERIVNKPYTNDVQTSLPKGHGLTLEEARKVHLFVKRLRDTLFLSDERRQHIITLCMLQGFRINEKGLLSYYPTPEAIAAMKRTACRPGRWVSKFMPELTDHQKETVVRLFKEIYYEAEYTLFKSKEAEDFRAAYVDTYADNHDPHTTSSHKNIAHSCLRQWDNITSSVRRADVHPTEAYASGDFEIWYTREDKSGKIGSRCVVGVAGEEYIPGPIYGVDDKSIYTIENALTESGLVSEFRTDWQGLRLRAIPISDGFIAPYLDMSSMVYYDEDQDCLVIDEDGDIEASDYGGILYSSGDSTFCCSCEGRIARGEEYTHSDEVYCDYCFHERFSWDDIHGAYIANYDAKIVHSAYRGYSLVVHCDHTVFDEVNQVSILLDEAVTLADGRFVKNPAYWSDSNVFQSDLTGEYHEVNDQVLCESDGLVATDKEFRDYGEYTYLEEYGWVYNEALPRYTNKEEGEEAA